MAINDTTKWHKFVGKVQMSINSTVTRSTKKTPFELMFGVKMANKDDFRLNEVLEEETTNEFTKNRLEWRQQAKLNISKIQAENKSQYDKKRKQARSYTLGELVAIQRVQPEKGLKVRGKMLAP